MEIYKPSAVFINANKFSELCALLGIQDGFGDTEEGVYLQVDQIAMIETALNKIEADKDEVTRLQNQIAANDELVQMLQIKNTALAENRDAWKANVERQERSSTRLRRDRNRKVVASYLDPENPFNQYADSQLRKDSRN